MVEEVQDISRQLGVVFNHVPREDNVMANGLAKESFLSSISFDVWSFLGILPFYFGVFSFGVFAALIKFYHY